MSEYIITREQLIEVFDKLHSWDFPEWLHEFVYTRKLFCPKLPEVVRCRDCKHYDPNDEPSEVYPDRYWCDRMTSYMPADGFCNFAERKEVGE